MNVYIARSGRVLEDLLDVSALEVGILLENLLEGPAGGNQTDHGLDGDALATDAGLALELVGFNGDPVEHHDEPPCPIIAVAVHPSRETNGTARSPCRRSTDPEVIEP
jgi:hypothetical protein